MTSEKYKRCGKLDNLWDVVTPPGKRGTASVAAFLDWMGLTRAERGITTSYVTAKVPLCTAAHPFGSNPKNSCTDCADYTDKKHKTTGMLACRAPCFSICERLCHLGMIMIFERGAWQRETARVIQSA